MSTRKLKTVLEKEVGLLTFGMFLRAARTSMDLSQSAMAKKLGISRGTLCDIEKGRQLVSPALAMKIAQTAGLSATIAIKACLEDQLRKANIHMKIAVGE